MKSTNNSSKKVLAILCELPFEGKNPYSNPSLNWLKENKRSDIKFVMRGCESSDEVYSLPESHSTFDSIKKYFSSSKFRSQVNNTLCLIDEELKVADLIWIRGPSFIPFIIGRFWDASLYNKMVVHLCANRFKFHDLKRSPSFRNLTRFLYGHLLKKIVKRLSNKGVQFCYTGSHVARNFGVKNGSYLVDFSYLPAVNKGGGVKTENISTRGLCLGRVTKLSNNDSFYSFSKISNLEIDIYGPGKLSTLKCNNISHKGVVHPCEIASLISNYEIVVCITHEYYEGFPRVIAEAICQEKWIVVSEKSVFINDVINYPKLIISETVYSKNDFYELLSGNISKNDIEQFKIWMLSTSYCEYLS